MFVRRLGRALTLGLIAFALAAPAAGAATVANTNDSGAGSLRQAIADAAGGETITVPAGEYTLTSGELFIAKSLTIAGAGRDATIIQSSGAFRVIKAAGVLNAVTLSGVKIRNGHPAGNPSLGGGVFAESATLTLRDSLVTENVANAPGPTGVARGGGVAVTGGGTLTLERSEVSVNGVTAVGASGTAGGVGAGGGVASLDSTLLVQRSTIVSNLADVRGGQGPADAKQLAGIGAGGGIWAQGGSATITSSTISENDVDATQGPGAPVSGIDEGGGIAIRTAVPGTTIASSTIDQNHARGGSIAHGGGIFVAVGTTGTRLIGDTITANTLQSASVSAGGGNLSAFDTSVGGTIISGGTAPLGTGNCDLPVTSLGFNLESSDQCGLHAAGDLAKTDPQLGPLQDAGGPTPTKPPARTSPVLDAGSSFGLAADQRGLPRPVDFLSTPNAAGGDGADIGAVEVQPSPTLVLGKLTRRRNGTAQLAIRVPDPVVGTLSLSGAGLKAVSAAVTGEGATLKIQALGKARKALRLHGRRRVRINVSYAPRALASVTVVRKAVLTQKRKRHRRRPGGTH